MNTLIALGTSAAYLYSVLATVAPRIFEPAGQLPDVYFDTAAVIIALILLGRLLEARARALPSARQARGGRAPHAPPDLLPIVLRPAAPGPRDLQL